jgi:hypothetical protein
MARDPVHNEALLAILELISKYGPENVRVGIGGYEIGGAGWKGIEPNSVPDSFYEAVGRIREQAPQVLQNLREQQMLDPYRQAVYGSAEAEAAREALVRMLADEVQRAALTEAVKHPEQARNLAPAVQMGQMAEGELFTAPLMGAATREQILERLGLTEEKPPIRPESFLGAYLNLIRDEQRRQEEAPQRIAALARAASDLQLSGNDQLAQYIQMLIEHEMSRTGLAKNKQADSVASHQSQQQSPGASEEETEPTERANKFLELLKKYFSKKQQRNHGLR